MPEYRVSPEAIADLEDIYLDGLLQFGPAQADRYQRELHGRFQLLAEFPGIAGKPISGIAAPVWRFPFGSHIILFTPAPAGAGIVIVRVFHARMDWLAVLQGE